MIVSEMSPKYRGIIPNGKEVFVFYEIVDTSNLKDGYLYAVIDELAIVGKVYNYDVSPIITELFNNNQNLKYYYDESDFRTSPPHIGYKVDNMGIFKGQGTYYKVEGSGERFVFFTNNEEKLLNEDAINSFNEKWMGGIVNDYDSIYFKKDGEAYWFVDSTVYKRSDHKRSINEV
jgi:ribosomal protein L24E